MTRDCHRESLLLGYYCPCISRGMATFNQANIQHNQGKRQYRDTRNMQPKVMAGCFKLIFQITLSVFWAHSLQSVQPIAQMSLQSVDQPPPAWCLPEIMGDNSHQLLPAQLQSIIFGRNHIGEGCPRPCMRHSVSILPLASFFPHLPDFQPLFPHSPLAAPSSFCHFASCIFLECNSHPACLLFHGVEVNAIHSEL